MAEYYTNSIGRKRRKRKVIDGKSLTMLLLDILATLALLILVASTVIVVVCQYISPAKSGVLSAVVIGAPIIYLLDIVVMFYWVVRWRWYRASIMIATVVLGLFYLSRYYILDVDRVYDTSYIERRYHKIMTYNAHYGRSEGLSNYIKQHNPDILCVQEMSVNGDNWQAITESYQSTYDKGVSSGSHILSKYRIVGCGTISDMEPRDGVWADLRIKEDTIRVVNLHLQSTSIRPEDRQFIEKHEYIRDKERENKFRSIISRLVENNRKRAVQAEKVAEFLSNTPYKVVVCGDFNDVPLSYTYATISRNLTDTFSAIKGGFAYTYNTKYRLLRIDNILVSPSVEIISYEVDNNADFSDHYPVISRVKFNQ